MKINEKYFINKNLKGQHKIYIFVEKIPVTFRIKS